MNGMPYMQNRYDESTLASSGNSAKMELTRRAMLRVMGTPQQYCGVFQFSFINARISAQICCGVEPSKRQAWTRYP